MYRIDQIEDAMIQTLKNQLPYLRTCESVSEAFKEWAQELASRTPAAYVVYEGGDYSHDANGVQDKSMTFSVVCVAASLRGEAAARRGGPGSEKGAYALLDDVRSSLSLATLGLNIDPLLPVAERLLAGEETVAVYAISFQTRCRFLLP